MQESAKTTKKHIFHHLKNKCLDEPANLVLDKDGNIIYNPNAALMSIACDWDAIYSSNVLHSDPLDMLSVVWPYLDEPIPFELPPLTGAEIALTIKQRNPMAAPGMDGWRTCDLQHLPVSCCEAIAIFPVPWRMNVMQTCLLFSLEPNKLSLLSPDLPPL